MKESVDVYYEVFSNELSVCGGEPLVLKCEALSLARAWKVQRHKAAGSSVIACTSRIRAPIHAREYFVDKQN